MSALPSRTDIVSVTTHVRKVQRTDIPTVPGHPQKDRDIFRGQPRKENFASASLFPLGDM
jgi:hypothetical protein